MLEGKLPKKDTLLCMDGDRALIAFAEAEEIEYELIIASKGEHVHETGTSRTSTPTAAGSSSGSSASTVARNQISAKLSGLAALAEKGADAISSRSALAAALG